MTDEQRTTQVPPEEAKRRADAAARGAGSGENANRTRQQKNAAKSDEADIPKEMYAEGKSAEDYKPENYDPESEYPEGDATKGKPDFNALAKGTQEPIAMRDHRAYLVSQAEKNERANDEIQARQVESLKGGQKITGVINDPDFQRDTSMETALAEVDEQSPEAKANRAKHREAMADAMRKNNLPVTVPGGKQPEA